MAGEGSTVPAIRDFTAAAESVRLREWGKSSRSESGAPKPPVNRPPGGARGAKKGTESPQSPAARPAWHSPRYNPNLQRGSPTRVVAPHAERSRRNVTKAQRSWESGLRDGAGDPTPLGEPDQNQDEALVSAEDEESRLWKHFQVEHDREIHELQRCLSVQQEEIADLKVKSLELQAAKDIAKGMMGDLQSAQQKYKEMEAKWMDCKQNLIKEQRTCVNLELKLKELGASEYEDAEDHMEQEEEEEGEEQEEEEEAELEGEEDAPGKGFNEEGNDAQDRADIILRRKEAEGKLAESLRHEKIILENLEQTKQKLKNTEAKLHEEELRNVDVQKVYEERDNLRVENEELRFKVTEEKEKELQQDEELPNDVTELKAKVAQLESDRSRDYKELQTEMLAKEQEATEKQHKLEERIKELEAQVPAK